MEVRKATNNDISKIKEVIFTTLTEYGLVPDPNGVDKDLDDLDANYFNNKGYFLVVDDENGEVVGCSGIYKLNDQDCELRKMYLLGSQRGKGLGRKMMDASLEKARELGYKKCILETASVLKEAISLYIKYGFKEQQMDERHKRCDQAYYLDL